jgi:hypothetical protein
VTPEALGRILLRASLATADKKAQPLLPAGPRAPGNLVTRPVLNDQGFGRNGFNVRGGDEGKD